jgi:peroxiredoxin
VFLVAGVGKLLDREGSRRALQEFGVPEGAVPALALALPVAEIAVAVGLLVDPSARYVAIAALLLLGAFIVGIRRALSRGRAPDCHCFGQLHSEPAGTPTVLRNAILAGLALALVAAGRGPGVPGGAEHMSGTEAELAAVSAIAIVLAMATAVLWGERYRARGDAAVVSSAPAHGLLRGMEAPDFELTALRGEAATLRDLTSESRPVVLIFLSAGCGSCAPLVAEIGRWQESLAENVVLAPIFSGERATVVRLTEDHDLTIALADEGTATFDRYLLPTMPSAVLIDPDGTIAGAAAVGPPAVEELIRAAIPRAAVSEPASAPGGDRAQLREDAVATAGRND